MLSRIVYDDDRFLSMHVNAIFNKFVSLKSTYTSSIKFFGFLKFLSLEAEREKVEVFKCVILKNCNTFFCNDACASLLRLRLLCARDISNTCIIWYYS